MELKSITLKNVLIKETRTEEDVTVQIIPFDKFDDDHVEFAYAYSDMLYRAPSKFKNMDDAARGYVKTFVAYEDENDKNSPYAKVAQDLRACRTLFNQDDIALALASFFENA